jgi:hypothetical protein
MAATKQHSYGADGEDEDGNKDIRCVDATTPLPVCLSLFVEA